MSLDEWWSSGRHVTLPDDDGQERRIFVRTAGAGPTVTLLHGYPSSSHDWSALSAGLEADHSVIALDLLGFGASEKPVGHRYDLLEQANLVVRVWEHVGVTETTLIGHDYSATLVQELVGRRDRPELVAVGYLNGGIYPAQHRPTIGQQLLLGPEGDELAAAMDEATFVNSVAATFGTTHPLTAEQGDAMWTALSRDDGHRLLAALLHYIRDRAEHGDRWIEAMETTTIPTAFVWGLQDPVSGRHMRDEIVRRMPDADVTDLPDVGHWPLLEDPPAVERAVRALLARVTAER